MADMSSPNTSFASFFKAKFDNICLLVMICFMIGVLTWVDKHGNSDYEKWLEVFIAGFGGAYLGLITASRQAWSKAQQPNGDSQEKEIKP